MIVTFDQKPEYFDFASRCLGANLAYGPDCRAITILYKSGDIGAVIIYTRFHRYSVEISMASDGTRKWMTRDAIFQVLAYPFLQLGKRRLTIVTSEDNEAAIKLAKHFGYVEEGRLRKWFGEKDGILMGMLREECKWLDKAKRKHK